MANKHRFRYGEQDIIDVPIPAGVGVSIGDFICRATSVDVVADDNLVLNQGCKASDLRDAGDAAANREMAADQLIGISLDYKKAGNPATTVRVATTGFFELEQQTAAAIYIGDAVEIYATATGPVDQQIVAGATSQIAVCVEHKTSTTEKGVLCKLQPPMFTNLDS